MPSMAVSAWEPDRASRSRDKKQLWCGGQVSRKNNLRVQPIRARKVPRLWCQAHEAACHSVYPVRKQKSREAGVLLPFCKISACGMGLLTLSKSQPQLSFSRNGCTDTT